MNYNLQNKLFQNKISKGQVGRKGMQGFRGMRGPQGEQGSSGGQRGEPGVLIDGTYINDAGNLVLFRGNKKADC